MVNKAFLVRGSKVQILTIIKANMKSKKGSFIGIIILMFLISAILTLVLSASYNGNKHVDEALDYANTGDLTLWFIHGTVDDEIKEIEELDEIEKVDNVLTIYTAEKNDVTVNGEPAALFVQFQVYDTSNHNYHVYNESKTQFLTDVEQLKAGEIYLPISLISKYNCEIGDEVVIETESYNKIFAIKGFIEEPTMGNPVIGGYKYAFISQDDFDDLYDELEKMTGELYASDIVQVYVNDDCEITDKELSVLLNDTNNFIDKAYTTVSRAEFKSYSSIMLNIFTSVLLIFGLILFVIVLIVIGHNISSSIEMDYKNLGILKSVGYRGSQLQFIYIVQYILSAIVGSLLGFAVGCAGVSVFNTIFVGITGLLIGDEIAFSSVCALNVAIWIFMIIFVLLSTIRITKIRPLNAIVEMRETNIKLSNVMFKISRKGLDVRMALRQITSKFKQYISSVFIIALLVFFIMCVEMIMTCFEEGNILEEFYGFTFDIEIDYKENLDLKAEVDAEIAKQEDIEWNSEFFSTTFTVDGSAVLGNVVIDADRFTNVYKGVAPNTDDEIVVTEVFAEAYAVEIGDTVEVSYNDTTKDFTITGFYQSVGKAGMQFSMLVSGLRALSPNEEITVYDYVLKDNSNVNDIVEKLKDKYDDKIEITTLKDVLGVIDTISSLSMLIVMLVYTISVIFILAVVSMVCKKLFIMEQHDYGIYKSLGFTSGRLRTQFSLRFICIGIFGVAFGLVVSVCLNKTLLGLMLKSLGITNFNANYTAASIIMPIVIMCVTLFGCSFFSSRRIKKVNTKILIVE